MIRDLSDFLKGLVPLSLILFLAQYFFVEHLKETYPFFYSTISIYLFHFFVSIGIFIFLILVRRNAPNFTGYAFLALSFLKMLICVLFLVPLIKMEDVNKIPDVIAFFIPFFLILFWETFSASKLLAKENLGA